MTVKLKPWQKPVFWMDFVSNLKASVWHLNTVEIQEGIWSVGFICVQDHVNTELLPWSSAAVQCLQEQIRDSEMCWLAFRFLPILVPFYCNLPFYHNRSGDRGEEGGKPELCMLCANVHISLSLFNSILFHIPTLFRPICQIEFTFKSTSGAAGGLFLAHVWKLLLQLNRLSLCWVTGKMWHSEGAYVAL